MTVDLVKAKTVWSGLATVRWSWRSFGRSRGRTRCAGRFRPTQVMRASQRGAQGRGDHASVARNDGRGSTAATASGRAERWRSRVERKKEDDGDGAPIYSREGCVRRRQLTNELAMEPAACHCARKRRRRSAASSCVAPVTR